ncbi:BQ2448_2908 [Microbotryum intermedium]|uniref:BQ2448_2908 protein n=1 Tax=Microbotryum intermedium TaxID=269621 RepID=A0A238FBU9_9BASI|nr:BQ2448_2908 [Microbotryum intermedium]
MSFRPRLQARSSSFIPVKPVIEALQEDSWNGAYVVQPPRPYELGHALESKIYRFLRVLAHRMARQEETWHFLRLRHQFDKKENLIDYWYLRGVVWKHGPSERPFRVSKPQQLLAAIRSEDAPLGDLVDVVTQERPLRVTLADGIKGLWAPVRAKAHFLSAQLSQSTEGVHAQ